jgi:hypothetical protein
MIAVDHSPDAGRLLRRGRASFLRGRPQPVAWRLEVREDGNDRGMFLPLETSGRRGARRRLIGYISAGGLRDLQPSRQAETEDQQRRRVAVLALGLALFWLVFRLVPCG